MSDVAAERPIRDAGLALSLMSVLPTSGIWPDGERTQVAAWFPAVGALYGALGYGIVKLGDAFGAQMRAPLVLAALIVLAWALLGRLMHWDGLADVADAFWGAHTQARRLEIMADSCTGAFGATGVGLVALVEVLALGAIIGRPHELPVLLVPVIARFSATAAAWLGQPARNDGLGKSVVGHPSTLGFLIGVLPVAGAFVGLWIGFHAIGLALGVFALIAAFAVPHILSNRFGGVTGDVMGASILITEAIFFAAFALAV